MNNLARPATIKLNFAHLTDGRFGAGFSSRHKDAEQPHDHKMDFVQRGTFVLFEDILGWRDGSVTSPFIQINFKINLDFSHY